LENPFHDVVSLKNDFKVSNNISTFKMNIGDLKHHIRMTIFPTDDVEKLKVFLPSLTRIDRNSLLGTTLQYDSIECFKLLYNRHNNYLPYSYIVKYAPPKICLYLKDNVKLHLLKYHLHNKNLAEYFCKIQIDDDYIIKLLGLYKNYIPYLYWTLIRTNVWRSKNGKHYETVWSYMNHSHRLQIDPERIAKEDWQQLMDFPWQGFINIHTWPLWDILLYAYPENVWLNKWNAPFIVGKIQSNVNKLMIKKKDCLWVVKFPWSVFNNSVTPPTVLYDIFELAEIDNQYLNTRHKAVKIIEYFQTLKK